MFTEAKLTLEQKEAMEVARVGFMAACPFYAHFFYSECRELPTLDIPTAATDGRTIYYNPEYLASLKPPERVFVLAHEMDHVICRDPQRFKNYQAEGNISGKPVDQAHWNVSADYVRNAFLMETGVGMMNPAWLYADDVTGEQLPEDVYARKWKERPKGGGHGGQGPGTTWGGSGKAPKGAKVDKAAEAQGGGFDQLLPPPVDPVTGKEDLPGEMEFKEAIARAASAAKAMGNMPGALQRRVDQILEPQVDWREHVRMVLTGHMGARHETWNKPQRRRLALNPIVMLPGRRGYGAELVVVGVDTSGSIGQRELDAFFAEVGGVLADVRPKKVILVGCDVQVTQVEEAASLDELAVIRSTGLKGGGGTSFVPVFDYVAREGLEPDTLIYVTDMLGQFPSEAPAYPTVWCATTDRDGPFGETVHIKL